jgi:hypothetical protein
MREGLADARLTAHLRKSHLWTFTVAISLRAELSELGAGREFSTWNIAGLCTVFEMCAKGDPQAARAGSDAHAHDVSILIARIGAVGRWRGWRQAWNVSMMVMRPPQQGHGWANGCAAGSVSTACSARPRRSQPE